MKRGTWRSAALGSLLLCGLPLACHTGGSSWMAQPLDGEDPSALPAPDAGQTNGSAPAASRRTQTRVIGDEAPPDSAPNLADGTPSGYVSSSGAPQRDLAGKVLGTFKNTYYDFPSEGDFDGEQIALMNAACKPLVSVPRTFYESICVQGSGTLKAGGTVSFAKRDCSCAAECPRTGQHICFDLLDQRAYPWGRGATGKGITPLVTVAVDSAVIPLGTPLYIPEYDGVARDASGALRHDGCFVAEDRGLAVQGQHVDIFTGRSEITQLWNRLVPSNSGVTVVVDSPHCKRASQ